MPGTNAGTGQPLHFRCKTCRERGARSRWGPGSLSDVNGFLSDVVLTGKVEPVNDGRSRIRSSNIRVEYRCRCCGKKGKSRHVDIARRAQREGLLS